MIVLFKDYAPSGWDGKLGGSGSNVMFWDRERANSLMNWIVAPVINTRDTSDGSLQKSNWETLKKWLKKNSPEGRGWSIESFGHWACGYYEIIIAKPGTKAYKIVEKASEKMEDYPALDDFDWSNCEYEAAEECWTHLSIKDRMYYIKNHSRGVSIFAARRDYLPSEDETGDLIRVLAE